MRPAGGADGFANVTTVTCLSNPWDWSYTGFDGNARSAYEQPVELYVENWGDAEVAGGVRFLPSLGASRAKRLALTSITTTSFSNRTILVNSILFLRRVRSPQNPPSMCAHKIVALLENGMRQSDFSC